MEQELPDKITTDKDVKSEKAKKLLIAVIALVLFGCIYYYYNNMNIQNPQSADVNAVKTVNGNQTQAKTSIIAQKLAKEAINLTVNSGISSKIQKDNNSADTASKPKEITIAANGTTPLNIRPSGYIRPTDKNSILKLALSTAGKADPFSDMGKNSLLPDKIPYLKSSMSGKGYIIPPPANTLPAIGFLPGMSVSESLPGAIPSFYQDFTVKGFIGDEVIVEVNGMVQSLRVNSSFQGLKVLNIDSNNLTAVFKINGKTVTRSIKSLSDPDNKDSIKPSSLIHLSQRYKFSNCR